MKCKKLAAIALSLLMLPAGFGCGIAQETRKGATLQVDLTRSYASEPFDMQGFILTPEFVTDDGVVLEHTTSKKTKVYFYDLKENTFTQFDSERKAGPSCVTQLPDGEFALVYNKAVDRRGITDIYDGKAREMDTYDRSGKRTGTLTLPDEMPHGYLNGHNLAMDAQGNWLFFANDTDFTKEDADDGYDYYAIQNQSTGCYVLNADFTVKYEIPWEEYDPEGLIRGASGVLYGTVGVPNSDGKKIYRFDCEQGTAEMLQGEIPGNARFVMDGSGGYEIYYSDKNGINGMRADGTIERILDFWVSDLPDDIWQCFALRDGTFLVNYCPKNSSQDTYYHMRPRTEEEIRSTQLLSLAGVNMEHRLVAAVAKYNMEQNQYRIVMKDYGKEMLETTTDPEILQEIKDAENEWRDPSVDFTPAIEAFKADLLGGIVPDIICMDNLPYRTLSNKGLLTDLAPKLAQDSRFDESKYYANILGALKKGDKLERIGFSFQIDTMVARTALVGTQQGRTPAEYIDMLTNVPEGTQIFEDMGNTQSSYMYYFLIYPQDSFIDEGTMTCSFDSPEFVKLLELTKTAPTDEEVNAYFDEKTGYSQEFWDSRERLYTEGKILLDPLTLYKPILFHDTHFGDFRKEDVTLVGFPETCGGNGGMFRMNYTVALTSQSIMQEPAWEFIMEQLDSRQQSRMCMDSWDDVENSLPVMRESAENALTAATRGANRPYGNMTSEEYDVLKDYIGNVRMYCDPDIFISKIIIEETQKYLAGDSTAQQAADMIQSRVSLYLSEIR